MDAVENRLRETWDRLALLLITQPREGWEPEFEEITSACSDEMIGERLSSDA